MKKKTIRLGIAFFLIVATAFVSCVGTYYYVSSTVNDLNRNQRMYQKLDVLNQVVSKYYILSMDTSSGYGIIDGVALGYIGGLDDRNSYYLNEKNYRTSSALGEGAVDVGIIPSYDKETGGIRVTFVENDSPAKTAGLKKNDIILSVDGINVAADGYRRAIQRMESGKSGSVAELSVLRVGESDLISISLERKAFASNTISYRLIQNNIGYIYINEFDESTYMDFTAAYQELSNLGACGYIVDIRFNSYGTLASAVKVADAIMPSGIIVSVKEKSNPTLQKYFSDEKAFNMPVVVIQNEETEGVAEVFAAALRDTGVASLVGTPTAGNGVGQRDIPLSDGTAVRLSTFMYITPSGESFNGTGVIPDYYIALDEEKKANFDTLTDDSDDQIQTAVEQLKVQMGIK